MSVSGVSHQMATGTLTPFFSIGFIRTVWPALCVGSSIQSCGKSISVPFHIYRRTNSIDFFLSVFYFFTRRCPPLVLLRRFHDTTPCPFFFPYKYEWGGDIEQVDSSLLHPSDSLCFFFFFRQKSAPQTCGVGGCTAASNWHVILMGLGKMSWIIHTQNPLTFYVALAVEKIRIRCNFFFFFFFFFFLQIPTTSSSFREDHL